MTSFEPLVDFFGISDQFLALVVIFGSFLLIFWTELTNGGYPNLTNAKTQG